MAGRAAAADPSRPPPAEPEQRRRPSSSARGGSERVAQLTGEAAAAAPSDGAERAAADTAELLRRVAAGVRSGDRARLGRDLHAVNAATGLGLSAVTPPVLHRLAGDLLGHEPRPDDLARLRSAAGGRVRSLLPGTSPAVLDTLLARICRAPARSRAAAGPPGRHRGDRRAC